MESTALEFRESCLEILNFLSSPSEQKIFASKVDYIDYKSEFVCWWFDDLVMESLPQGPGLISESFTPDEKLILWEFTKLFEQNIDSENQSIDELLKDSQWKMIMVAAQETLAKIV
ncbi:hypothetical protein Sbal223_1915 [Shewanella baltica OS223]|uniref:hypothetical protein n=1 Tax=Shewanella baltica TaxID=62322 RepID=UPI0001883E08|nr:hypothetical protein [Shewanella baltica]ACK46420.1 hypothetical protein Sbal223_1915 [Shewanella baltica OS223]